MKNQNIERVTTAAVIAALYVLLTLLSNAFGLASGMVQLRLSEALTVLPYFTPAAVPGLFLGCLLSNLLTGCLPADTVAGSLTTLLAALLTAAIGKRSLPEKSRRLPVSAYLAALPPVVLNTLVIPPVLRFAYGIEGSYLFFTLTVGLGEFLSAGVLGTALLHALKKKAASLFR